MNSRSLHMVAFALVIIGALNWGLVGLVNFDLVAWLFVDLLGVEILARLVYILVGVAAVYEVVTHKGSCVHCGAETNSGGSASESSPSAQHMGAPGAGM